MNEKIDVLSWDIETIEKEWNEILELNVIWNFKNYCTSSIIKWSSSKKNNEDTA